MDTWKQIHLLSQEMGLGRIWNIELMQKVTSYQLFGQKKLEKKWQSVIYYVLE